MRRIGENRWWICRDSNPGIVDYEPSPLPLRYRSTLPLSQWPRPIRRWDSGILVLHGRKRSPKPRAIPRSPYLRLTGVRSQYSVFPQSAIRLFRSALFPGQAGIEPATLRLLAVALPTELLSHNAGFSPARIPGAVVAHIRHGPSMIPGGIPRRSSRAAGGIGRIQTGGLVIPNHALCQLSYYSILSAPGEW